MLSDKKKQVAAQCRVVAHLASVLADVHKDYKKIVEAEIDDGFIDRVGKRTASYMDQLGDMLNAMDIVSDGDAWTNPIFEAAHKLWPREEEPK